MTNNLTSEFLTQAVECFFDGAKKYDDTRRTRFAAVTGMSQRRIKKELPHDRWILMRREWLRKRFREVMDDVYRLAETQEDFTIEKILDRTSTDHRLFRLVMGREWEEMSATLPSLRDKVLATLQKLVEANTPANLLTVEFLYAASGVTAGYGSWFSVPLRAARLELAARQKNQEDVPPEGADVRIFPGGWVDLESDEWDLKIERGIIRRSKIREDVAQIAWPILKEEVRAGKPSLSTIYGHYRQFILAADLLGTEVPDVRNATTQTIQRAWHQYGGTRCQIAGARAALVKMFTALFESAESDSTLNYNEILNILNWLSTGIKLQPLRADKQFLSEDELDGLFHCCLSDIRVGIDFTSDSPNLKAMSTLPRSSVNAAPVVNWATALMIMIMGFTGLRGRSVMCLRVNDWLQIRPSLTAIAWGHPKKREENIAVTPTLIARLVDLYIQRTDSVRRTLSTNRIFLMGDSHGYWCEFNSTYSLTARLHEFSKRHELSRDGTPIILNSTMLRRTYVTRQLYKGVSLQFLKAQLGHEHLQTTKHYAQFDRYEHPGQVRNTLDAYGRRVLDLWHSPVLLDGLDAPSRAVIFEEKSQSDGHGLSEIDKTSIDIEKVLLPSCSLCKHLITGAEFSDAWEAEHKQRELMLREYEDGSAPASVMALTRSEFEFFESNYSQVKKEC
jgi:integrase